MNDQWYFTLRYFRNHNRIDLASGTQHKKKENWQQYRDNYYLENSKVYLRICIIRVIEKKVKQGGINRNEYRMKYIGKKG